MTGARQLLAVVLVLAAGTARAFHDGGVAECDACHVMHADGAATAGRYLLRGPDASSICLGCHAGATAAPHAVLTTNLPMGLPPANYTPGGDFGWLSKTWSWALGAETSPGERHGHNVAAADFGLLGDPTRTAAPGGTYPAASLSCISCHDPHGRYRTLDLTGTVDTAGKAIRGSGSYGGGAAFLMPDGVSAVGVYRLLGGVGYAPRSIPVGAPFVTRPPVALAPLAYNRSERTADVRVAYGSGMSEWCRNCHGGLHATGLGFQHAAGAAARLGTLASTYNAYVKTGDLSGTEAMSYTSLVPYEEGTADRSALAAHARSDGSATSGPITISGPENVMCLSCHRAHASGWDHAMRWNAHGVDRTNGWIVADGAWPGIDAAGAAGESANAQGRSSAETRAAMYDRDPSRFAPFQRSLCNKCHAADAAPAATEPAPSAPTSMPSALRVLGAR